MKDKTATAQRKFRLQILAFILMMVPPLGLYYTVTLGLTWATWVLMGLIAAGMVLAMRVT